MVTPLSIPISPDFTLDAGSYVELTNQFVVSPPNTPMIDQVIGRGLNQLDIQDSKFVQKLSNIAERKEAIYTHQQKATNTGASSPSLL